MSLIHVDWWGYFYQWHNASSFRNTVPLMLDASVWHSVSIEDAGAAISITLDGQVLDFADTGPYPISTFGTNVVPGYVGIGGGSNATVTYAGVHYGTGPTPARPQTWGAIKGLYSR